MNTRDQAAAVLARHGIMDRRTASAVLAAWPGYRGLPDVDAAALILAYPETAPDVPPVLVEAAEKITAEPVERFGAEALQVIARGGLPAAVTAQLLVRLRGRIVEEEQHLADEARRWVREQRKVVVR